MLTKAFIANMCILYLTARGNWIIESFKPWRECVHALIYIVERNVEQVISILVSNHLYCQIQDVIVQTSIAFLLSSISTGYFPEKRCSIYSHHINGEDLIWLINWCFTKFSRRFHSNDGGPHHGEWKPATISMLLEDLPWAVLDSVPGYIYLS